MVIDRRYSFYEQPRLAPQFRQVAQEPVCLILLEPHSGQVSPSLKRMMSSLESVSIVVVPPMR